MVGLSAPAHAGLDMDSLAQYGDDDDDSDNDLDANPSLIGPLPPSRSNAPPQWNAAPSSPPAHPTFVLPPPDFGDGPAVDHIRYSHTPTYSSKPAQPGIE